MARAAADQRTASTRKASPASVSTSQTVPGIIIRTSRVSAGIGDEIAIGDEDHTGDVEDQHDAERHQHIDRASADRVLNQKDEIPNVMILPARDFEFVALLEDGSAPARTPFRKPASTAGAPGRIANCGSVRQIFPLPVLTHRMTEWSSTLQKSLRGTIDAAGADQFLHVADSSRTA
jgi:hypothetical protein